ncbi:hypothetical protein L6452_03863 [Arctium lappa]|uniref:Uncharacterized protein n=1 Tax=Arctium lappa TaxID=4217 RepID=A0ACB9FNK1_ARCLA|nr:hypothetical protein L6452_03863 [Arctium lappa]
MANLDRLSLIFVSLLGLLFSFVVICNADEDERHTERLHFGYIEDGSGPSKWGSLKPEWKTCSSGVGQSPIDVGCKTAQVKPDDLKATYKLAPARLVNRDHAIAVEWQEDAGGIEINGVSYKLIQCHWHTPSEHTLDGTRYDAELHLVHKSDGNRLAVIASLHKIGESDPFIGHLADKIKMLSPGGVDLGKISASAIKFGSIKNYRYIGSLTTPPCDEDVIWTIGDKIRPVAADQLQILKKALKPEFDENARPLQGLGERQVWQFELPGDPIVPEKKRK